jgi:hypothetical protein
VGYSILLYVCLAPIVLIVVGVSSVVRAILDILVVLFADYAQRARKMENVSASIDPEELISPPISPLLGKKLQTPSTLPSTPAV